MLLTFLGDVYLPKPVMGGVSLPGDLVINLEAPITKHSTGWPDTVNLRASDNHLLKTFGRPPFAACLGNNHIMDFGTEGLKDTFASLEAIGTIPFGAGSLNSTERYLRMVDYHGSKLAFLSFVCPTTHPVAANASHPGVALLDESSIRSAAKQARIEGCDRIILNVHWGLEDVSLPRPQDVALARRLATDGVFDILIGHHGHCIQGWEVINQRHIFYGLGNAIFPDVDVPAGYDKDGKAQLRYSKHQQYWNFTSLAILYDPAGGEVACLTLRSTSDSLQIISRDADRYRLTLPGMQPYERRFARRYLRDTWRKKLVNYARNPVMPRPKHLRSLYRIALESLRP